MGRFHEGKGVLFFFAKLGDLDNFFEDWCVNYEDLIKAQQQLPSFGNVKFSTYYRFKDITLKGIMNELKKYSPVIQSNVWIALNFWRTGLSSDDEYLRFEQVWKAFEIFYRTTSSKTRIEIASVRSWLTKNLSSGNMQDLCDQYSKRGNTEIDISVAIQGCQSAFDCLVKQNYTSKSGNINYSKDLKIALAKGNHHEILANTLMCLSKLRNNVFHANIFSDKERPLVFVGCSILADILTSGFLGYINQRI